MIATAYQQARILSEQGNFVTIIPAYDEEEGPLLFVQSALLQGDDVALAFSDDDMERAIIAISLTMAAYHHAGLMGLETFIEDTSDGPEET